MSSLNEPAGIVNEYVPTCGVRKLGKTMLPPAPGENVPVNWKPGGGPGKMSSLPEKDENEIGGA